VAREERSVIRYGALNQLRKLCICKVAERCPVTRAVLGIGLAASARGGVIISIEDISHSSTTLHKEHLGTRVGMAL
jgi:hypothetical protein